MTVTRRATNAPPPDADAPPPPPTVLMLPLDAVKPNPRNARDHSAEQIATLANSIEGDGFNSVIVVDENHMILAGHGRVQALRRLGRTHVPAIVREGLSEQQKQTIGIADNQIGLSSTWKDDVLMENLRDILAKSDDLLTRTGFDIKELRARVFPVDKASEGAKRRIGVGLKYQLLVECADEEAQGELLGRLREEGFTCKPMIL